MVLFFGLVLPVAPLGIFLSTWLLAMYTPYIILLAFTESYRNHDNN